MRLLIAAVFLWSTLVLSTQAQSPAPPAARSAAGAAPGSAEEPVREGAGAAAGTVPARDEAHVVGGSVQAKPGGASAPAAAPAPTEVGAAEVPSLPAGPLPPAPAEPVTSRPPPAISASEVRLSPPAGLPADASPTEPADLAAARALWVDRTELADAWVAFEAERDTRTRAAERVFFPLALALQAGLGVAYAVGAEDVSDTSRILAGATAGLTLAAAVPAVLSSSRGARRAWFSAGGAAFAFGAGATIIMADRDDRAARWVGASVALQGLAFLPIALIPGFPDEADYRAYEQLPAAQRADAAARLLTRIDRFEQRVTAISVVSALCGAAVLATGALVSNDGDQARTLAGLSLIPLGTVLAMFAPRLFVRDRLDRFSMGERPTKLPFNGW